MDEPYSPQLIQSLNELHGLLSSEATLESTLTRVAELACATIDGCDSAGVSLVQGSKLTTAVGTDEFTLKIDKDQYSNAEGPCLEAAATHAVVSVDNVAEDRRWPRFAEAASKKGLGSVLSLPLSLEGSSAGALNLYSRRKEAFEEASRPVAILFSSQASVALSNAESYATSLRLVEQLREAIKTRDVIGEAKGILMAREGVNEDEAFQMLKRVSQNQNVKLRDIAQRIVDEEVKNSPTAS